MTKATPMELETIEFDPSPCGFPRPRVSLLPDRLNCVSLGLSQRSPTSSTGTFRDFTRGRYALRESYRQAGVASGTALLAPAYHCRTMLDPALALGGDVALYPLSKALTPDFAAIRELHRTVARPVKALLVTHFFGFPVALDEIATWCAENDITLIEDCSHAMFGQRHRPLGVALHGRFVVSSPYKFLTAPDGGLLWDRFGANNASAAAQRSPGDELRALRSALFAARQTAWPAHIEVATDAEVTRVFNTHVSPGIEKTALAGASRDYIAAEENRPASMASRFLQARADLDGVADARRKRYRQWVSALSGIPSAHPLYPMLPDGCIPYMFPLLIDQPYPHFYWLKRLGVPIWRWDSIAVSACPTATHYRLHLLHLPCHQSIGDDAMQGMLDTVCRVLSHGEEGGTR